MKPLFYPLAALLFLIRPSFRASRFLLNRIGAMPEEPRSPDFTSTEVLEWAEEFIREAQNTAASYEAWCGLVRSAWRYAMLAAELAAQEAADVGRGRWGPLPMRPSQAAAYLDRPAPEYSFYETSPQAATAA